MVGAPSSGLAGRGWSFDLLLSYKRVPDNWIRTSKSKRNGIPHADQGT